MNTSHVNSPDSINSTNWSICVFCQNITTENLQHPSNATRNPGSGYATIAQNLEAFHQLGHIPLNIDLARLGGIGHIDKVFLANNACWHKSCSLKFNNNMLQRVGKKRQAHSDSSKNETKFKRTISQKEASIQQVCFLCDKRHPTSELRSVSTFQVDSRVRKCALKLMDTDLLAKLSPGDLIAQEAKYHAVCLSNLYRRASQSDEGTDTFNLSERDEVSRGLAFAQLTQYIEDCREVKDLPIFKLSDLTKLYANSLENQAIIPNNRVHSTRLKEKLLDYFPDLQAHAEGRETILVFTNHIGQALKELQKKNYDEEGLALFTAAKIVRRDIFALQSQFSGKFTEDCQTKAIPQSLLALVEMIIDGTSIDSLNNGNRQAAMSLSQLIVFNSTKRRKDATPTTRHNKDRETPLPLYIGLSVHAKTRKRDLVDLMYNLGISVSYDRVLEISTDLANKACMKYEKDQAICPSNLKSAIFTTSAIDNIDHNPSSTTAQGSFHGTGISLFQHPSNENPGVDRNHQSFEELPKLQSKSVTELPEFYSNIPPAALKKVELAHPRVIGCHPPHVMKLEGAKDLECRWLEHVERAIHASKEVSLDVTFAAYHAKIEENHDILQTISSLLPLFPEQAESVAMLKHGMKMIERATYFLHPGQIPVVTADQPLYALMKQIQWQYPNTHGEKRFVILLGGLHIEMAYIKTLGSWLKDSGWTDMIIAAQIASPGKADSFLKGSHVRRSRRAHEITVCALYHLMLEAHEQSLPTMTLDDWCKNCAQKYPTFQFWLIVFNLELLLMTFVRSLRKGDFQLYIQMLDAITPWMFALDHTHYARWLPVHIQDLKSLKNKHPAVEAEFNKGNFVVHKTKNVFSAIPIDQAHEQNNARVKGDGGAIGLTENEAALRRWTVGGPEINRLLQEFETSLEIIQRKEKGDGHHEQKTGTQTTFVKDILSLAAVIEECGNPFLEESTELLVLTTKDIVNTSVVETLKTVENLGQEQYQRFVNERLINKVPLSTPIKKNNLPLISSPATKKPSMSKLKVASLKSDCSLFSRLYISCQTRDGDLDEFFRHENQPCPPSISQMGMLRPCSKSVLLECLDDLSVPRESVPTVDTTILDGAAIINMLKPGTRKTFADYANTVFLKYLKRQLETTSRLDIIWDQYITDSLKASARIRRGYGKRRRVEATTCIPHNWQEFLRCDANKEELFMFLGHKSMTIDTNKQIISTVGEEVICNQVDDLSELAPCNQEEADTRMMLHMSDACKKGNKKYLIRTVDTDVVVLAIASASVLDVDQVWIAFGTGKNFRYIAVHEVIASLGPSTSRALPLFHSITGCDTVSSFNGIGKKTAWNVWKSFPDVTETFLGLSCTPDDISDMDFAHLERFVILLYDRTSDLMKVNNARKHLFATKGRALENIPPTEASLREHVKRAVYQGGHVWGQCLIPSPVLPSPSNWGWMQGSSGEYEPLWTTLSDASKTCQELLKCSCQKGCKNRCKCVKAALKCTALCACGGVCDD